MMEALGSFETSVLTRTTRRSIEEDYILLSQYYMLYGFVLVMTEAYFNEALHCRESWGRIVTANNLGHPEIEPQQRSIELPFSQTPGLPFSVTF
jgi:hypothetical protein